jgi:mono/diheme cytochrome c family protein
VTKVSPTHGVSPASAPPDATTLPPFPLTFDAETKEALVKPGDTNAFYVFRLTNTSPSAVVVDRVWTSCGCTAARLPSLPWVLAPEADGQIEVELDLRGKRGILSKSVYLYTPSAFKILTVNATVPDPMMAGLTDRLRNMQAAAADRQAVFRADCAPCHAEPGKGKLGRELFQAVCAICHEAEHRATRVPDLRALDHPPDAEHWRQWIRQGKTGTLMPAFAQAEGGPLTDEQVRSLVEYLGARDPARWPVPPPAPPPARP